MSLQQKMSHVQRELKLTEDDDFCATEDQLINEKSTKTRSKVEVCTSDCDNHAS